MLDILREAIDYDPCSGRLTWRVRPRSHFGSDGSHTQFNTRFAGKEAGTIERRKHTSYRRVNISGKFLYGHTIAWALTHGEFAPLIDHRDRDGLNNTISNLRLSTKTENALNVTTSHRNSTGVLGVYFESRRGVFVAQATIDGKRQTLCRGTLLDCAGARIKFLHEKEAA